MTIQNIEKTMHQLIQNKKGILLSKKYKNMTTPLYIQCHNGHKFRKTLKSIRYNNRWCPICPNNKESKGEKKVRSYLESNNIKYRPQKSFKKLRGKKKLKFDFGGKIYSKNWCIEFDGKQHFEKIDFFGGFEKRRKYDIKKTKYCNDNEISLLRIDYTCDQNKIEKLLTNFFIKLNNKEYIFMLSDDNKYNFLN